MNAATDHLSNAIVALGGLCTISAAGTLAVVPQQGEYLVIRAADITEVFEYAEDHRTGHVQRDVLSPHMTERDAITAYMVWLPDFIGVHQPT